MVAAGVAGFPLHAVAAEHDSAADASAAPADQRIAPAVAVGHGRHRHPAFAAVGSYSIAVAAGSSAVEAFAHWQPARSAAMSPRPLAVGSASWLVADFANSDGSSSVCLILVVCCRYPKIF